MLNFSIAVPPKRGYYEDVENEEWFFTTTSANKQKKKMKAKRYTYRADINLPQRPVFKFQVVLNANPKASTPTVVRRLNKMIKEGTLIRVSHGLYRKVGENAPVKAKISNPENTSLSAFMKMSTFQKAHLMDEVIRQLINEEVIVENTEGKLSLV